MGAYCCILIVYMVHIGLGLAMRSDQQIMPPYAVHILISIDVLRFWTGLTVSANGVDPDGSEQSDLGLPLLHILDNLIHGKTTLFKILELCSAMFSCNCFYTPPPQNSFSGI